MQARAKQFPSRPQELPGTVQPHTLKPMIPQCNISNDDDGNSREEIILKKITCSLSMRKPPFARVLLPPSNNPDQISDILFFHLTVTTRVLDFFCFIKTINVSSEHIDPYHGLLASGGCKVIRNLWF